MATMEILMLVGGLSAFVISFFLPDGKTAEPGEGISQEELQQLFDDEVELSRQKIGDMTKETLDYSMEKTERSLEKIANEKIMAVGEYSDTVLDQINQSHNQVVFLSDMLHKSKEELTELLNRADQASKDANARANEAYDLADHAMKLAEDAADRAEEAGRTAITAEEKMIDARRLMQDNAAAAYAEAEEVVQTMAEPADAREEWAAEKKGAEERLAESLASFRESLKETEPETEELSEADAFEEPQADEQPEEHVTDTTAVDDGFTSFKDTFGTSEPEVHSAQNETFGYTELPNTAFAEQADVAPDEERYEGLSEEEKMEALLRAATEELAQDISGIAEARWEPDEAELAAMEEPAEEYAAEEIDAAYFDEEAEAREEKARALDALKAEAETEDRESKARALEALKAEAESLLQEATEEEMAPAEDAEFLQNLLKEGSLEDIDRMADDLDSEPMPEAEVSEAEELTEKDDKPAKKTTAKKPAKKSTKAGGTSRKKSSKQNEQMSIPEELLKQDNVSLQFAPGEETTKNNNARILEMHRMGRSDMAIAKDLGMGIGEVKLVIALDEIS